MSVETDAEASPSPPESPPVSSKEQKRRAVVEWTVVLVVAVAISLLVRAFVFQTYYVPSGSMIPTLQIGDRIMVNKLSVDFGTIHRGDVIVFRAPAAVATDCSDTVADLVKRVIGLPHDVVTSKGNTIYVNGKVLKEKWPHTEPLGTAIGHVLVPANDYFVMGDNHSVSCDSRMWGFVPRSSIIGKVFVRIWPFSRIGWL